MKIGDEQITFLCNRIFHPYWKWEDWKNGIHKTSVRECNVEKSRLLLSNSDRFFSAMLEMFCNWKHACEQNLTNNSRNRLSFLGQAACSYLHQSTISETTCAWWRLTQEQRDKANKTAEQFINKYEQEIHRSISL